MPLTVIEDIGGGGIESGETLEGAIDEPNDVDIWTFYGNTGQIVTIAMDAGLVYLDALVELHFSPLEILEAYDDDGGTDTNALINSFQLTRSGFYEIRTFGGGNTVGPYNLTLTIK